MGSCYIAKELSLVVCDDPGGWETWAGGVCEREVQEGRGGIYVYIYQICFVVE